ncbi:unnamed protein product [Discosporangium mesarthrocarpum]
MPPPSAPTQGVGISTFLLSTALVQLVFNLFSDFRCGLGTSMAENIPFLNVMASGIIRVVVSDGASAESAMPSVMVAYALSTMLVGLMFYTTGCLKLGQVLHFFPRHVILGCIGGFGVFLLVTALEISTGVAVSGMGFLKATRALFSEVRGHTH